MRVVFQIFFDHIGVFFILYMAGYASFLFLSVAVAASTLFDAKKCNMLKNELLNDYFVPVSVIVPAHNESVTIKATIESLLELDYPLYEIVVVDDGSTDDTSKKVREAFQMIHVHRPIQRKLKCQEAEAVFETRAYKTPITLIRKRNGGKADAGNK